MRLLIITQKVSKNDTVLGFFHRWIIELAKNFESIIVICLEMGEYSLPDNVKVLSLGKEERQSRLQYLVHFFWYIQHERKNYDAVLVHMNQEYLLLAGWLWRLWGKKVTMWRNHHSGSLLTGFAAAFCHKIFCTSKYSYTARYKKTLLMPVGIDTDIFKPDSAVKREPKSILFLARISPTKKPHILVEALGMLKDRGESFTASIYGDALQKDMPYYESLKSKVRELGLGGAVAFHGAIPNADTPDVYCAHDITVNLSSSGMYDKTIFEAMACESLSLSSNKNLEGRVDPSLMFREGDAAELAARLEALISMDAGGQSRLRRSSLELVRSEHSLDKLARALERAIQSIR